MIAKYDLSNQKFEIKKLKHNQVYDTPSTWGVVKNFESTQIFVSNFENHIFKVRN